MQFLNVQYLSKAMLDYSETSENVYLTFNQHIKLKNKKFEILVHLTFKSSKVASARKLNLFIVVDTCKPKYVILKRLTNVHYATQNIDKNDVLLRKIQLLRKKKKHYVS